MSDKGPDSSDSFVEPCPGCNYNVPLSMEKCPHCGKALSAPNLRVANLKLERDALANRYQEALNSSKNKGCDGVVAALEQAIQQQSKAVINRGFGEIQRLASSDRELYSTYYNLTAGEIKQPDHDKWHILRHVAESVLFPGYKEGIRFAALTLNDIGLPHYGAMSMSLRNDFIKERSTIFEENVVIFMGKHDIKVAEAHKFPKGYRASWEEREKLCVAKLADELKADTKSEAFPTVLLRKGTDGTDDHFVEVHIWGPITIRTVETITVQKKALKGRSRTVLKALQEDLAKANVQWKEVK